jgi:hypothetical protein
MLPIARQKGIIIIKNSKLKLINYGIECTYLYSILLIAKTIRNHIGVDTKRLKITSPSIVIFVFSPKFLDGLKTNQPRKSLYN